MTETKLKMITDAGGKSRWYRIEERAFQDAFDHGQFSFKTTPITGTEELWLNLRAVWCLKMHGNRHVCGESCGVFEIRCLQCGLEYSEYPRL